MRNHGHRRARAVIVLGLASSALAGVSVPVAAGLQAAAPLARRPPAPGREAPAPPPPPDSVEARIDRVTRGLLLPVRIRGEEPVRFEIESRLRHHRVPAVSVAVIEGGRIEWARAWGLARVAGGVEADTATLFQAASISKPIAALAPLRLADRGRVELDAEVDRYLRTWGIPRDSKHEAGGVTLRRLLSHTAGLSVHGFRGYAADEDVPGILEVLEGAGRANSPPVVVEVQPGSEWRYSGGGYTVAQLLVEEVAGRPFADEMREILDELGMWSSTYGQPLPDSLADRAAAGYRAPDAPIRGRWHTYPEAAAAGLWTTPSDLARYAILVGRWLAGEEGGVLSPAMTRDMLAPGKNGWGLGPATAGEGLDFRFEHDGSSEGYRGKLVTFPRRGIGAAIMTNGDGGDALVREILYAIAEVYEWPDIAPRRVTALPLSATVAIEYAGRYRVPEAPDLGVELEWRGGRLELRVGGRPAAPVARVGRDRFVILSDGAPLRFERGPDGRVGAAVAYGTRALRERR